MREHAELLDQGLSQSLNSRNMWFK